MARVGSTRTPGNFAGTSGWADDMNRRWARPPMPSDLVVRAIGVSGTARRSHPAIAGARR